MYDRKKVTEEELCKLIVHGRKKWVKKDEGAMLYSMGMHTFEKLAKEAKATYRVTPKLILINTEILDEYMEYFREEEDY